MTRTAKAPPAVIVLFWDADRRLRDPGSPLPSLPIPPLAFPVSAPLGPRSGVPEEAASFAATSARALPGWGPGCGRTKPPALTSGPLSARPAPSAGGAAPRSHPGPERGPAASPAAQRSPPARARARRTCKLVPPALPVPGEPERPQPAPPARLQPWVSQRAGPAPPPLTRPRPRAPAPPPLRWGLLRAPPRPGPGGRVGCGGGRGAAQVSRTPRCASPPYLGGVPTPAALGCARERAARGRGREGTPGGGAQGADGASRAAAPVLFSGGGRE